MKQRAYLRSVCVACVLLACIAAVTAFREAASATTTDCEAQVTYSEITDEWTWDAGHEPPSANWCATITCDDATDCEAEVVVGAAGGRDLYWCICLGAGEKPCAVLVATDTGTTDIVSVICTNIGCIGGDRDPDVIAGKKICACDA